MNLRRWPLGAADEASAREKICLLVGLTLASMESAGKISCYSKIVSKFAPATFGDFWISGTNVDCPSTFRWCSRNLDFIDSELKWKAGHPVSGLGCVYLEVRNGSVLLATADCSENKTFLCDIRKNQTSQKAMQAECANIWNITSAQIDLLMNVTAFLTASISINLKCFLKCVGVEVGMFNLGALNKIPMLRQIEFVSQEEPTKLEEGFVAFDECSNKNFDDECVTAHETYKCGQEKAPQLVSKIINNNLGNGSFYAPPTPCVPVRRTCWLSELFPCEINQTAIDTLNSKGVDNFGYRVLYNGKTFYVGNWDTAGNGAVNPVAAFKRCCELGMKLYEPATLADVQASHNIIGTQYPKNSILVGETEFINQTHEVWCRSRVVVQDNMYDNANPFFQKFPCRESIMSLGLLALKLYNARFDDFSVQDMYINPQNYPPFSKMFFTYICEKY
ncbi:Hypothetical predicted protein [Cloeon dipterum]|uniref:C-type lectin domain-containing protein n=1 Tax=Cloeon dipterum TaxID=197152 RepID=A0A8S1E1Z4_9INSE|nr:Hypothetical predicted protein [Cloeon dipterum]